MLKVTAKKPKPAKERVKYGVSQPPEDVERKSAENEEEKMEDDPHMDQVVSTLQDKPNIITNEPEFKI